MNNFFKIVVLVAAISGLLTACSSPTIKTSEQGISALTSTGYVFSCDSRYEGDVECNGSKDYDGNTVQMHIYPNKQGVIDYFCEVSSGPLGTDYQFLLGDNWWLEAYGPEYGDSLAQQFIYEKLQEKIGGYLITNDPWSEFC